MKDCLGTFSVYFTHSLGDGPLCSLRALGIQDWIRRHPSHPQEANRNDQRRWSQMWMLPREVRPKVICAATWTGWWGSRRRERGLRWWSGVGSGVLPLTGFTGPWVDKAQLGKLEGDSRSRSDCRHVYCLSAASLQRLLIYSDRQKWPMAK